MLQLRNNIVDVISKLTFSRYSKLLDWYSEVEERLSYEEYEDPNQTFVPSNYLDGQIKFERVHMVGYMNSFGVVRENKFFVDNLKPFVASGLNNSTYPVRKIKFNSVDSADLTDELKSVALALQADKRRNF